MLDDFQPARPPEPVRLQNSDDLTPSEQTPAPKPVPPLPLASPPDADRSPEPVDRPRKRRFNIKRFIRKPRTKKEWAILAAIIIVVVGSAMTAFALLRSEPAPPPVVQKEEPKPEPPKPTTEPSRLSGLPVKLELNKRPVTGVMIENSPDARPQAGLKEAGVVFEAVAEGGITRFLALYQETQPGNIGPVRSVRPYYLDFLMPFDAAIAHVGGSPEALAQIRNESIKDLDQFFNPGAYSRSPKRFAPHNMYTNMTALDGVNKARKYTASKFTGFVRKPDAPAKQPSAKSIDLNISSFLYNVHYDYVPKTNSYNRSQGGRPHIDENSNSQISPKVVVALVMPRSIHPDGVHTVYGTSGSGELFVFQDGVLAKGTWQKKGRGSQFVFKDSKGKPFNFNAGQTWLTMVNPASVNAQP